MAFAELEQFIDTPVKHYSSGMYMRLGFAIAISVEPDILVIDEVLAVGDAAFRQKCFTALAEFKQRQKTILFVTHNAAAVRRFCDEAIWLDGGLVRASGPAGDVLAEYLAATATRGDAISVPGRTADPLAVPRGPVTLLGVETLTESGAPERHFVTGEQVGVRVRFRAARDTTSVSIGVGLHRADGLYLSGTSTAAGGHAGRVTEGEGEAVCWLGPLPLAAAEYTVSAAVWTDTPQTPDHRLSPAARFRHPPAAAPSSPAPSSSAPAGRRHGALALDAGPDAGGGTLARRPEGLPQGRRGDQARPAGSFGRPLAPPARPPDHGRRRRGVPRRGLVSARRLACRESAGRPPGPSPT